MERTMEYTREEWSRIPGNEREVILEDFQKEREYIRNTSKYAETARIASEEWTSLTESEREQMLWKGMHCLRETKGTQDWAKRGFIELPREMVGYLIATITYEGFTGEHQIGFNTSKLGIDQADRLGYTQMFDEFFKKLSSEGDGN